MKTPTAAIKLIDSWKKEGWNTTESTDGVYNLLKSRINDIQKIMAPLPYKGMLINIERDPLFTELGRHIALLPIAQGPTALKIWLAHAEKQPVESRSNYLNDLIFAAN
jgi:hypothetical protein